MSRLPLILIVVGLAGSLACAQAAPTPTSSPPTVEKRSTLDTRDAWRLDQGGWTKLEPERARSADEATIASAREALANERPGRAVDILDPWIEANINLGHPLLAEALLLRGDAHVADGDEWQALYDYEELAINHPGTEQFLIANERELDIGTKYVKGLKRRWLGMRIASAQAAGEELLVRVQERLPGTILAERACIELADHYYRERALTMAADAYEVYTTNYPTGPNIARARERRIFANIARYKGPNYDAAGLVDAKALIREYAARDPEAARTAGLTDAMISKLDESQAAQLIERAQWYLTRRDPVGARSTWRRVVRDFPQTLSAQNALRELKGRGWSVDAEP